MKTTGKFEKAAMFAMSELLKAKGREIKDMTHGEFEFISLASEIDRLNASLEANARSMAKLFAKYADEVAERGACSSSTPCGYSTIDDIQREAAAIEAKTQALKSFFKTFTGVTLIEALKAVAS